MAYIALFGIIVFGLAAGSFAVFIMKALSAGREAKSGSEARFDAVMLHTYCPKHSIVPLRGEIVSESACDLVSKLKVPLILAVGHTVPGETRTESKIYHDYIRVKFPDCAPYIVLGEDSDARDTRAETQEAARILKARQAKSVLVVGIRPHLVRIQSYWQEFGKGLFISFIGVDGPKRYYIWEFIMLILETILPPGSRRREFALDIAGRKK